LRLGWLLHELILDRGCGLFGVTPMLGMVEERRLVHDGEPTVVYATARM
jgi:hypothetical protein